MIKVQVSTHEGMQRGCRMPRHSNSKLNRVEGAKTSGQTMPRKELLRAVEISACDREHRPQPGGDIGQEPSPEQGKVGGRNLASPDLPCEDRLQFNHAKVG